MCSQSKQIRTALPSWLVCGSVASVSTSTVGTVSASSGASTSITSSSRDIAPVAGLCIAAKNVLVGKLFYYVIVISDSLKKHPATHCLVGLVVTSAIAEQEDLGSIPGSGKVLFGFSIGNFSVAVTESGFVPG